jgi:hypothetical protein
MVRNTILVRRDIRWILAAVWMPFIPGMLMSSRTISGFSSLTFLMASLPSIASPQTGKSCQSRKDRIVFRATELSSTIRIRGDKALSSPAIVRLEVCHEQNHTYVIMVRKTNKANAVSIEVDGLCNFYKPDSVGYTGRTCIVTSIWSLSPCRRSLDSGVRCGAVWAEVRIVIKPPLRCYGTRTVRPNPERSERFGTMYEEAKFEGTVVPRLPRLSQSNHSVFAICFVSPASPQRGMK